MLEKFKEKCSEYGLNYNDFVVYDEVIMLNTSNRNVYVLFDKYFNTIAVHKVEFYNMHLTREEIAKAYCQIYDLVCDDLNVSFLYPFRDLSLKQIVELDSKTKIYGSEPIVEVNGKKINDEYSQEYIDLLCYIKFLKEEIDKYFLGCYKMTMLGFDYPNVYEYIRRIMLKINEYIDICTKNNKEPNASHMLSYLGNNQNCRQDCINLLNRVIELLISDKGYEKVSNEFITKVDNSKNKNLYVVAMELLKLLKLSDNTNDENKYWQINNFISYFEQDAKDGIKDNKVKKLKIKDSL